MRIGVIFHIDENSKWNLLLNNVQNLISSGEYDIEVLANGEAVAAYAEHDAEFEKRTAELARNVQFAACNHSLTGRKISREKLPPFVKVVPSGVQELVQKQSEGYAYIKP